MLQLTPLVPWTVFLKNEQNESYSIKQLNLPREAPSSFFTVKSDLSSWTADYQNSMYTVIAAVRGHHKSTMRIPGVN